MALYVVATPIGNPQDLSQRAIDVLKSADLVIGEELKVLRQILKNAGVMAKQTDQLNEHSKDADVEFLANECRTKKVALVSDCGTPGFADPGALLTRACLQNKIPVHAVPGPSSMMALLSVCGVRVDQFLFYGFLPAKQELRDQAWNEVIRETKPVILLETPYRAAKLMDELQQKLPNRLCVVGLNLTQENERLIRAKAKDLGKFGPYSEAEPAVLICPASYKE